MNLVADIGGTKTVIAATTKAGGKIKLQKPSLCINDNFESFEQILDAWLKDKKGPQIEHFCIGLAGPVFDNKSLLTNLRWEIDGKSLAAGYGISSVVLMNDLVAAGYGIDEVKPDKIIEVAHGINISEAPRVLISPGTGLGETVIPFTRNGYFPVASEGGHAHFAPFDGTTARLWEFQRRFKYPVTVEDFLSGPGLGNIYRFIVSESGRQPDEEMQPESGWKLGKLVTDRAFGGSDSAAREAISVFLDILAAELRNLTLKSMAIGGVYIGGGIIPRLLEMLDKERFVRVFSSGGAHQDLLRRVPIKIITDTDLPLYGAAHYLFWRMV